GDSLPRPWAGVLPAGSAGSCRHAATSTGSVTRSCFPVVTLDPALTPIAGAIAQQRDIRIMAGRVESPSPVGTPAPPCQAKQGCACDENPKPLPKNSP